MGDVYLNGRPAVDFEVPAIERGRRCERSRELDLLAGVLTQDPPPRVPEGRPRPVTDVAAGFN